MIVLSFVDHVVREEKLRFGVNEVDWSSTRLNLFRKFVETIDSFAHTFLSGVVDCKYLIVDDFFVRPEHIAPFYDYTTIKGFKCVITHIAEDLMDVLNQESSSFYTRGDLIRWSNQMTQVELPSHWNQQTTVQFKLPSHWNQQTTVQFKDLEGPRDATSLIETYFPTL
jgi:hypothetical protein